MDAEDEARLKRLVQEQAGDGYVAALADTLAADAAWPSERMGRRLLARAKAAIGAEQPRVVTIVARAVGALVEVVSAAARAGQVEPTLVRGGAGGGALVRQRLGGREVTAYIETNGHERFVVILDLGADAADRRTRLTLFRGDREVMSEEVRQGRVLLPELTEGTWEVEVRDSDGWVGTLDLALSRLAA